MQWTSSSLKAELPSGIQKSIWEYPKNLRTIEL